VHARLSTVTFLPRGSFEDAAPTVQSESVCKATCEVKVAEMMPSVPQLPYCRASKNLFAACARGDLDVLKALLADINGDHSGVQRALDTAALSSGDSGSTVASSSTSADEEVTRGVDAATIEAADPADSQREVWDLIDVLNMPESFEDMSTCLHLASERGKYIRVRGAMRHTKAIYFRVLLSYISIFALFLTIIWSQNSTMGYVYPLKTFVTAGLAAVVFLLLSAGADPTRLDVR
jgi:hypothetical protein